MFKKFFNFISRMFTGLFKKQLKPYKAVFVEELDDVLKKDTIYITGEGIHLWSAAMLCPCGCGEILHMSLHKEGRPRWELTHNVDGTISLWPSIWRKQGCGSHFFFESGFVRWCSENDTING